MSVYDEIEIEDMEYSSEKLTYTYPCPCGDKFSISLQGHYSCIAALRLSTLMFSWAIFCFSDLYDGEEIAGCASCSLKIRVIFDADKLPTLDE